MTTNLSYATGDGHITSSSTNYTTASGGSSLAVTGTGNLIRMGQNKVGSTYEIYEAFFTYAYSLDANEVKVTGYFDFYCDNTYGTSVAKDWGVRNYDWNEPLGTDNWRTPSQIAALDRIGYAGGVGAVQDQHVFAIESTFNDRLLSAGPVQIILYNGRISGANPPAGAEYQEIRSVEFSGNSTDPVMVWTTVPVHTLVRVSGCAIELSDGRHVYVDATGGGTGPTMNLVRHDGTTATNIATNLLSGARDIGSSNQSLQQYALTRDNSDNIYLVTHAAGGGNTVNIVTWKKTGSSSWAEQPYRQAEMPFIGAIINNLAVAWHNVGVGGTLMIVGSHESSQGAVVPSAEMFFALINCDRLLNGIGTLVRQSGSALDYGLVRSIKPASEHNPTINPVGNGLDVVAMPGSNLRGLVVSHTRESNIGEYAPVSIVRYQLNATTAILEYVHEDPDHDAWTTKDAGAKVRVLPISDTRFAVVTLDMDSGWGPTIRVLQNSGTSSSFTGLAHILLHGEGIASLPSPSTMHDKSFWDAVYQPEENMIWFYYWDTADGRRLMRTGINLATFQAVKNEIQVATAVGAAGSTNHSIRVDRGRLMKSEVLIAVANRASGGAYSTIYIVDKLNVSPLAPTLVDKANYDATAAQNFDWTFNDPNVGDTQTAFQLIIENSDTLAVAHDTGKVVSAVTDRTVAGGTLSNGNNYRWKVRTWDTSDSVGPYSAYDFFVASASGTVTITSPAADNPTPWLFDDVTISWSTSGITQASYKVRVVRTDTGAQVSDTGFITSTATSANVTGLSSDIEYRIELTVRNSALVSSNTALRLITPNYNEPETPLITVVNIDQGGYNLVSVSNPVPQGDRPEITQNNIQRKRPDDTDWVTITVVAQNGSYRDYAVASGTTYEYRVVAIAPIGFSESAEYEVTLQLMGVWLHRPYAPEESAKNYIFGKDQRSDAHQSYHQLTRYAGREYPVADFAHYHDDATSVTVDIPFGETWAQDIAALRALETTHEVLVLRDNRGRHIFGVMISLNFTDVAWGTQASWDHQRVDYDEDVS